MTNQLLKKGIDNPIYFRYGFFIFLIFSIILNSVFLQSESNYYILYIFTVIFLGVGFYNKPTWFLVLCTVIVVVCRYYLIPDSFWQIGTFLIHLFTYLLIMAISAGLMKYVHRTKVDHIDLTTTLAKALDSRDTYTLHHSENVAEYSLEIARRMKLSKDLCNVIYIGGLLHDIGKIGIPEHILLKPGKLTDEEYQIIKGHPTIGYEMIKHVQSYRENGILDIVLYHHERYDGKGYPTGISGKQIPLVARIVAVADAFDAMRSKRIYRDQLPLKHVLNEMGKNKGTQFDPEVVDVLQSMFERRGQKDEKKYRRFA